MGTGHDHMHAHDLMPRLRAATRADYESTMASLHRLRAKNGAMICQECGGCVEEELDAADRGDTPATNLAKQFGKEGAGGGDAPAPPGAQNL